jgi:hypothetical protein
MPQRRPDRRRKPSRPRPPPPAAQVEKVTPAQPARRRPKAAAAAGPPPVEPPSAPPVSQEKVAAYEVKKERERRRSAASSIRGREIGEIPPPKDPARRRAASRSVRKWCATYVPHWFGHTWSPDLVELAGLSEKVLIEGGQQPVAMPRGGGKTTIAKAVALMGALEGHRKFLVLIGANKELADDLLDALKYELLTNDKLLDDYPEAVIPIRNVGGIANRCGGQTHKGEPTFIEWGRSRIVLPAIEGSAASGVVVVAKGLTGGLRGLNLKGTRPDFALLDDIQTDQSARSQRQIRTRLRLVKQTVRGLAGPGKEVAIFAMLTIIQPGDAADQLLDPALNADWQGKRYKLLYDFPKNLELWRAYNDVRQQALRGGARGRDRWKAANAFYRKHRAAMDLGGRAAWKARKLPDQLSALQFAMDLYFDDEAAFLAEFQNTPQADDRADGRELTAAELAGKINGLAGGVVPLTAAKLTAFIDVQHDLLYWAAAAWSDDMTGAVVDYQAWPEQRRRYFTYKDAAPKLSDVYKGHDTAAAVRAGLIALARALRSRTWPREGGGQAGDASLDLLLVDWGDGELTGTIAEVCRLPEFLGWLIPSRGIGLTPASRPMHEWTTKPGEKIGDHWFLKISTSFRVRAVDVDVNHWKSYVAEALAQPLGNRGALSFFGPPGTRHDMLADHLASETRQRLRNEKTGRASDVWKLKPGRPDNHLLDCLTGCAVGASLKGCSARGDRPTTAPRPSPGAASAERQKVRSLF